MSFSKSLSAAKTATERNMLSRAIENLFATISLSYIVIFRIIIIGYVPTFTTLLGCRVYWCPVFLHVYSLSARHLSNIDIYIIKPMYDNFFFHLHCVYCTFGKQKRLLSSISFGFIL